MGAFINISNHPSAQWTDEQRQAALTVRPGIDRIVDVPFPAVPPEADKNDIIRMAIDVIRECPKDAVAIMVQGEHTLTARLVAQFLLFRPHIRCYAATSERRVIDHGDGRKTAEFRFVRFREYSLPIP